MIAKDMLQRVGLRERLIPQLPPYQHRTS